MTDSIEWVCSDLLEKKITISDAIIRLRSLDLEVTKPDPPTSK